MNAWFDYSGILIRRALVLETRAPMLVPTLCPTLARSAPA